jgi:hypothetical protein
MSHPALAGHDALLDAASEVERQAAMKAPV